MEFVLGKKLQIFSVLFVKMSPADKLLCLLDRPAERFVKSNMNTRALLDVEEIELSDVWKAETKKSCRTFCVFHRQERT